MALDFESGILRFEVAGIHGRGSVSLPDARAGDKILRVWFTSPGPDIYYYNREDYLEPVVTVDDEIQVVTYEDLTDLTLYGILLR